MQSTFACASIHRCRLQVEELYRGSRAYVLGRKRKDSSKRGILDALPSLNRVPDLWYHLRLRRLRGKVQTKRASPSSAVQVFQQAGCTADCEEKNLSLI